VIEMIDQNKKIHGENQEQLQVSVEGKPEVSF